MDEFGAWSGAAGGFVVLQTWSTAEANAELELLVAAGEEDRDDHAVLKVCPDHRDEEPPRDTYEECFADD